MTSFGIPDVSGSRSILAASKPVRQAAVLQQLDMDVAPETWRPPPDLIPRERLRGIPHHGLGRGFKVGKEEIAGLVVALERFAALDMGEQGARWEGWLAEIANRLDDAPGVFTRLVTAEEAGGTPVLEIGLADGDAWALSRALQEDGEPPVHLAEGRAAEGVLLVKPAALREGDAAIIAERLMEVLTTA